MLEEFLHHFLHPHEPVEPCDSAFNEHEEKKENRVSIFKAWINSCLKRDYPPKPSHVIPTSNVNGIHLDEFRRYDKNRPRLESTSPQKNHQYYEKDQQHLESTSSQQNNPQKDSHQHSQISGSSGLGSDWSKSDLEAVQLPPKDRRNLL